MREPVDHRAYLRTWAAAHDWRELRIQPWARVGGSEAAWLGFLTARVPGHEADIALAYQAAQDGEPPETQRLYV